LEGTEMQTNNHVPGWAWDFYQNIQEKASSTVDDPREEKLSFLGQLFHDGKTPATMQKLNKLVDNHSAANRGKLRRRNRLREKYLSPENGRETDDRLASRDSLETIRQSVALLDWQVLNGIAKGYHYQELSDCFGVPVGTLKSAVSRARSSLQEMAA
jgi:hypothetical protein